MKTTSLRSRFGQIEALGSLEDGWLGGSSKAPDKLALGWVRDQLDATFPEDLPLPSVAPTPEGGLFMEWVRSPVRVSVEILLPDHQAECQAVNLESGDVCEAEGDLDQPDSWPALYAFVRRYV